MFEEEKNYETQESENNYASNEGYADIDSESESKGLGALAIAGIAAAATYGATVVVPKVWKWGKGVFQNAKTKFEEKKKVRKPEEGKEIEPTDEQIKEATK